MAVMNDYLLRALAEELKTPLLQISREAEASRILYNQPLTHIEQAAATTLRLVDSFILGINTQSILELEPVTISSVLYDSAHALDSIAKQYNREIVIDIRNKCGPVMARREHLSAAFTMLGHQSLSQSDASSHDNQPVTLGVHKSRQGIVAGVFSADGAFASDAFKRAKALGGTARQSFPSVSHTNGASILLADALLQIISSPLKPSRHQNQRGLAATFLPSAQLRLV